MDADEAFKAGVAAWRNRVVGGRDAPGAERSVRPWCCRGSSAA